MCDNIIYVLVLLRVQFDTTDFTSITPSSIAHKLDYYYISAVAVCLLQNAKYLEIKRLTRS
jgi:hypothetical protein